MSKNKSGPKRKFPLEVLENLFEQHEKDIVIDDKVLRPADKFWIEFKKKFNISSTEKFIYTDAIKWLQKRKCEEKESDEVVHGKIRDFDDILEEEISVSPDISDAYEPESSDQSIDCAKTDIQFSIKLTNKLWKLIEPVSSLYHRRTDETHKSGVREYLVLKPGFWSNVFVDKIAEHPKNIICDWSFKRAKVSSDGKYYVLINANCINCQAKLFAVLKTKPIENEDVTFTCIIKGFNEVRHKEGNKKVKVSGSQAQSLATSSKSAIVLHRQMSVKSGKMFELPKGRVPSSNAIRNLQSRNRAKEKLSPDMFKSLLYLQASKKYCQTIHMIGLLPFYVIFGSNNQFRLYNMYEKRNPLTKISCDATGSVVRKIGMYSYFTEN